MSKQTEKKKINPILWFLFAVVIPLIIVLVIIIVILNFAGFNVVDWTIEKGKDYPIIEKLISYREEKDLEQEVLHLKPELDAKSEELEQAESQISDLEEEILQLNQEIESKEEIINSYESEEAEKLQISETENQSIKEIASSFEEMKAGRAAEILSNLEQQEVILIMTELPHDVRGEILQAMEPEFAATITSRLLE